MNVLTQSRLKSFRACQRQHHYSYVLGYRPVRDAEALRFGTAIHAGLEAYWKARAVGNDDLLGAAVRALPREMDRFDRAKATAMLAGYVTRWALEPVEEVLGVEMEFALPLVNPLTRRPSMTWKLGGKIDALIRLADRRIAIVEHKTTSEDAGPGSSYRAKLTLDGQVSQYFMGAESLGWSPDVVIYDVLRKPTQRPLDATPEDKRYKKDGDLRANAREHDETPDEYCARVAEVLAEDPDRFYQLVNIVRLAGETETYTYDVWQLGKQIRESELSAESGVMPPRNPDACDQYSRCAFWDVCTGTASLDDRSRFRVAKSTNEELSPEAA